jgi:hypothetical protein
MLLPLAAGVLLVLAITGCGGGTSVRTPTGGTPPGTYNLTVTGTAGSGSAVLTHSQTLTLTVT